MKSLLSILLLLVVTFNLSSQKAYENLPALIAHGAGEYNGESYPNSVEALKSSLKSGFLYVELDILLSSDGYPFAAHDWEMFNEKTGYPELGDSVLTLEEIESRKLFSQYTPITYKTIISYFEKYPDWVLVTDKLDDPLILDRFFSSYKDRIIVEAFSLDAYYELVNDGYNAMLSLEGGDLQTLLAKSVEHMIEGEAPVDFIVVHYTADFRRVSGLQCLSPFRVATYTVNDEEFMEEHLGNDVDLIYTDSLKP